MLLHSLRRLGVLVDETVCRATIPVGIALHCVAHHRIVPIPVIPA
jgi:hypothetical protein